MSRQPINIVIRYMKRSEIGIQGGEKGMGWGKEEFLHHKPNK